MKKWIIIAAVVGVAGLGWLWGSQHMGGANGVKARYKLAKVERRDMLNTISATGSLSAVVTVAVGTEVSGQIKELLVDFNSPVTAGQVIARIDPESYETLVRQAEAELAVTKAKLETQKTQILRYQAELENTQANNSAAQAQVKKARVSLEDAGRQLERQKVLVAKDFVSKNDFDQAQTAYDEAAAQLEQALAQESAARSNVASAKAALAIAKAQVNEAKASVDLSTAALDKRNVDLENTIIRSPVNGVVIDRDVDVGQTVAASLSAPTLFTIAQDLSKMQVSTHVDEADIGRIREGQPAQFTVDAFGSRQFQGHVQQVRKMGETVQNVVTYEVIISADNEDLALMPGMTADVQIELLKKPGVLAVPNAALRFTPPDAAPEEPAATPNALAGGLEPSNSGAGGAGSRPDPEARIKQLAEALDLSEAQQDALRDVFKKIRQQIMAARQEGGGTPMRGPMSDLRSRIRKETQNAILRILNADQRLKYEALSAQREVQRGRVWFLDADGRPKALPVVLGVSDTTHTEVSGTDVREGMDIIVGTEL